jgi:hypothetical protein
MKILDRLPIYAEPVLIEVRDEVYQVWQNQTIVWVSLDEALAPFLAILDSGHSHNFSIARRHMERWGRPGAKQIGHAKISGHLVPRYASDLFVYRNQRGTHRLAEMHRLEMEGGFAVVPDELPIAPRLPLVGLQTIIGNRLRLLIDGDRRQVTLKTKGWLL